MCVCVCEGEGARERANAYRDRNSAHLQYVCMQSQQRATPHGSHVCAVSVFISHNGPG